MSDHDLTTLLARTAADDDRPVRTDLDRLLARARHGRTRRRGLVGAGIVGGAALLTAATVAAVTALQPTPAPAPAAPPHRTVREQPLTDAQIRERCLPQLAKYATLPMYDQKPSTARWTPLHAWDYRTGDVVLLQGRHGNPAFCHIPKPGQERGPVPFQIFTPTMGAESHLRTICAQQAEPRLDLRTAAVGNSWSEGEVTMTLLVKGSRYFACATEPVTWDAGLAQVSEVPAGLLFSTSGTTGAAHKSIVDESAAWTLVAGHVTKRARTLMLLWPGLKEASYPISEGNVAAVLKVPTTGGLRPVRWRLLDAAGKEIQRGRLG